MGQATSWGNCDSREKLLFWYPKEKQNCTSNFILNQQQPPVFRLHISIMCSSTQKYFAGDTENGPEHREVFLQNNSVRVITWSCSRRHGHQLPCASADRMGGSGSEVATVGHALTVVCPWARLWARTGHRGVGPGKAQSEGKVELNNKQQRKHKNKLSASAYDSITAKPAPHTCTSLYRM